VEGLAPVAGIGESRFRWAILAAGTFAQTAYTSVFTGLVVLAPALRVRYGLGLVEVGLVLAAPGLGSIATLYLLGRTADRVGERAVIGFGLGACSLCVAAAAYVSSFEALTLLLVCAGAAGAGTNSASGRAVMHWFDADRRGTALGVRQTAVPIAGAWVALVLPSLVSNDDPRTALLALAAVALAGTIAAVLVLRENPSHAYAPTAQRAPRPLRDRRIWLLSAAAGLMVQPQVCLVGFFVVFLHLHRDVTTSRAALALAALNVLGVAGRIGAGSWSDAVHSRIGPLRLIALASAGLVALCAVLLAAPLAFLVPALVVMGCVTISWNGLSFAAVAETAGPAQSGAAIGIQQTALAGSGALLPILFGALVEGTSWRLGFAISAVFPLAGWWVLGVLPGRE
jgi:sugar phosphate permease